MITKLLLTSGTLIDCDIERVIMLDLNFTTAKN